jgi:pimeloyl-[acyl-carrier protein] synthase
MAARHDQSIGCKKRLTAAGASGIGAPPPASEETPVTTELRERLLQSDLRELIAPDIIGDPYPAYEALRGDPVRMKSGTAVITNYADGATALRDEAFVRETMPNFPGRTMRTMADMLIILNPPKHTKLRSAVTPLVPPAAMDQVERRAYDFTRSALTAGRAAGGIEIVSELAIPLALTVIADLLGIADRDADKAKDWAFRLNKAIDSPVPLRKTRAIDMPAQLRQQQVGIRTSAAMVRSVRYANRVLRHSKHQGTTTAVPSLQDLVADGAITQREAASIWLVLLLAGIDTVQTMLTSAIWLLSEHPDQYEALVNDHTLLPAAIEEVLRYESPTRLFGRVVDRDLTLSGLELARGDDIVVIFGAANRDPDVFPEPHRFDITRERTRRHLAFGHGIHFCLGAQLARAEATGALKALIETIGESPLTTDTRWRPSYFMRSLDHLRLRL